MAGELTSYGLSRGRSIVAGLITLAAVLTPTDYTPPFSVFRAGDGTISHNFNIDAQKPAYTNTIYVGPGGSNANNGSTYALRVVSLGRAIVLANALGGVVRILVDPAVYRFSDIQSSNRNSFNNQSITCSLVIEPSSAGRIISLHDVLLPAYVATSDPNVWVSTYTTETPATTMIDRSKLDANGRPTIIRKAYPSNVTDAPTIIAALNARHAAYGQGGCHVDTANKKVYCRPFDGRQPDANVVMMSSTGAGNLYIVPVAGTSRIIWCNSVEVWGNGTGFRYNGNATANCDIFYKNCAALWTAGHGFGTGGGPSRQFAVDCYAQEVGADGFNYQNASGTGQCIFHEFQCSVQGAGVVFDGDNSNNGSSCHNDGRGVRVNCSYYGIANRPLHDIGTVQSWNIGGDIGPLYPTTGATAFGPYASVCAGYPSLAGTAKVYVDSYSLSTAVPNDMYAYDGGQVFYCNMRTPRLQNVISGTGSGISAYTP